MTFATVLLIGACLLLASRVYVPWAGPTEGQIRRRMPEPIRARVRRLAVPLGLQLTLLTADSAFGWIPYWVTAPALALTLAVLVAPIRYTFTDQGIAVGPTSFRRWTEFGGLSVRRGRIRLTAIDGLPGVEISLPGRFEDAEVVTELRALLRGAYKGAGADGPAQVATTAASDPDGVHRDESAAASLAVV